MQSIHGGPCAVRWLAALCSFRCCDRSSVPPSLSPFSRRVPPRPESQVWPARYCKEKDLGEKAARLGGAGEVSEIRQVSEDGQRKCPRVQPGGEGSARRL